MARRRPAHNVRSMSDAITTTTAPAATTAAAFDLFDLAAVAAAIAAAHRSGLLEAVLSGPGTAAEQADRLGLEPRATAAVLDVLAAHGLVGRDGDRYGTSGAVATIDAIFPGGHAWVAALLDHVPVFLSTGLPFGPYDGTAPERESSYTVTVDALGRMFAGVAEELADRLPGSPRRILDVGAGSGVWSLAMAERTGAHVTALDLPGVAEVFLELAARRGMADRTSALTGDFHEVRPPAGAFDRAVLANVVHLEPSARARALIARTAETLGPGGDLVVIEPVMQDTPTQRRAAAVYALHLVMRTRDGRAHGVQEIEGWMREAGLEVEEPVVLEGPPTALVAVVARRPA